MTRSTGFRPGKLISLHKHAERINSDNRAVMVRLYTVLHKLGLTPSTDQD